MFSSMGYSVTRHCTAGFSLRRLVPRIGILSLLALCLIWHLSLGPAVAASPPASFQRIDKYLTGTYCRDVAVGDFNEDGKPEFAVVDFYSCTVTVFINNGDGTFIKDTDYSTGTGNHPISITTGDFNSDNKLDLAVATNNNSMSILFGYGTGKFSPQAYSDYKSSSTQCIATGDFNEDGKADLVLGNTGSENIAIKLGYENGDFSSSYMRISTVFDIAVGKINDDAYQDLILVRKFNDIVSILLGNGDGTFTETNSYNAGTAPDKAALGDFNADGNLDLAVTNSSGVAILLGNGNGTFQEQNTITCPSESKPKPYDIVTNDFNADGNLDLAVTNIANNAVFMLLGNGNGAFDAPSTIARPTYNINYGIGTGNFDSNSRPDLVVISFNYACVMLNNTTGTLANLNLSGNPNLTYNGTPFTYELSGLILTGTDQGGQPFSLTGQTVTWEVTSGNASVSGSTLSINSDGQVNVTATVGGVTSNTLSITVGKAPAKLKALSLNGTIPGLVIGDASSFNLSGLTLKGKDQFGEPFNITGLPVTWQLAVGDCASISGNTLTAVSPGQGSITATISGITSNLVNFTVTKAPPTVTSVTLPNTLVKLNSQVSAAATFTDPYRLATHTAVWDWGDGNTSAGIITESNGYGSVSGTHIYASSGFYCIKVTVSDNYGTSDTFFTQQYVIVYNPNNGSVRGNGIIKSPEGSAFFTLHAEYTSSRANVPTGLTSFLITTRQGNKSMQSGFYQSLDSSLRSFNKFGAEFSSDMQDYLKRSDPNSSAFVFLSTSYDWLVVNGNTAYYQGSGSIGGKRKYGFLVAAQDNQNNGEDRLRIKIWDKNNGTIIFDNQAGEPDITLPNTVLTFGNIKV